MEYPVPVWLCLCVTAPRILLVCRQAVTGEGRMSGTLGIVQAWRRRRRRRRHDGASVLVLQSSVLVVLPPSSPSILCQESCARNGVTRKKKKGSTLGCSRHPWPPPGGRMVTLQMGQKARKQTSGLTRPQGQQHRDAISVAPSRYFLCLFDR